MKAVGIIAEYDPFHKGHAWQIAQARQQGAKAVAVCMSGDLVQRGAAALLPPWVRAKAALCCGADLVIELPNPWACLSAEGFASAGVYLLSALPELDGLVFGAEQADTVLLQKTARILLSQEFSHQLTQQVGLGMPFAAARANAAGEILPQSRQLLNRPNNNLGVEYCKAILQQKSCLVPVALERRGAGHGQSQKDSEGYSSASYLRECWQQAGVEALHGQVPDAALQIYRQHKDEI
ncbi:nucleotidyltransferase, partial [gut metagenome]